ncbi:MAG: L,D-transpeptidase [Gaiellaceae bacterium]
MAAVPGGRRNRPTARARIALAGVALVAVALMAAALTAWPQVRLAPDADALARVDLPSFAGHISTVHVRGTDGKDVPARLRDGKLWPSAPLRSGERLTVTLTVRRPAWAGWLIGRRKTRTFTVETPTARLLGRWLQVKSGAAVTVGFDQPVSRIVLGREPSRTLSAPLTVVPLGVTAAGTHATGSIEIAAAARRWERLPVPTRVTWFPARPYPQLLAGPTPGSAVAPDQEITLTFSQPVRDVLGAADHPLIVPSTPGHWRLLDAHTLAFDPSGLGYGFDSSIAVDLPRRVQLAGSVATPLTRSVRWHVPAGSTLRLQQLLAQIGYLPLDWHPASTGTPASLRNELSAAIAPPAGRFTWRYPRTPAELRALWQPGRPNQITRGAVMSFEHDHRLAVDAIAGPHVWRRLIADALANRHKSGGYSYVYVHRNQPQSLNLWHDGRVVLTSPGNTGVPAAPTQLGTFQVFEHIPAGTMSGTNPDGSHYHDPGIRWISYFHHGDAIHAFNRASFGTPQSLGCVELPTAAAAKVWPYTPIGTLVTIEN